MICLGIESTAHTFGVGIVTDKGEILANEKAVYTTQEGGMIPDKVAKHHLENKDSVLKRALENAKISLKNVDLISYAHGPGLSPSLLVGRDFAKKLALENKITLIGINHAVAHLTIGELTCKVKNPVYLYVSGANTQVIALSGRKFRVFGETLDVGIGNALDKFGRDAGLGFPAGPKIEELARKGVYQDLPYSVKGMDIAFAGIITKATRLVKEGGKLEDACHSLQETMFAMLAEISERAMAHIEKDSLLLIGGVAANKRLIEVLMQMCLEREAKFNAVPLEYSGDNGAMIAWQGILEHKAGKKLDANKAEIYPYERTDDIDVIW